MRKNFAKNCDIIVANDISSVDSGMESDTNEVTILFETAKRKFRADQKYRARAHKNILAFARKTFDKNVMTTELV
jgi:phosphopantothenoylcysteine synthetase/decarboxylase